MTCLSFEATTEKLHRERGEFPVVRVTMEDGNMLDYYVGPRSWSLLQTTDTGSGLISCPIASGPIRTSGRDA